jgi:hypothetical protein
MQICLLSSVRCFTCFNDDSCLKQIKLLVSWTGYCLLTKWLVFRSDLNLSIWNKMSLLKMITTNAFRPATESIYSNIWSVTQSFHFTCEKKYEQNEHGKEKKKSRRASIRSISSYSWFIVHIFSPSPMYYVKIYFTCIEEL